VLLAVGFLLSIGYLVVLLAVVYAVAHAPERRVSLGQGLSWIRGHFGSVVWVNLLVTCITLGGFLLFIIPGIILSVAFSFALLLLVREDVRGLPALLLSRRLIKGYWWGVFLRQLGLGILFVLVGLVVGILAGVITGILDNGTESELVAEIIWLCLAPAGTIIGVSASTQLLVRLRAVNPIQISTQAKAPERIWLIALGWFGLLAGPVLIFLLISAALMAGGADQVPAAETVDSAAKERLQELRNF